MKVWEMLVHTAELICNDATTTEAEKITASIILNNLPKNDESTHCVLICSESISKAGQLYYHLWLFPEENTLAAEKIVFWDVICHRIENSCSISKFEGETSEPLDLAERPYDPTIVLSELSTYPEEDLKALNLMAFHLPKAFPWSKFKTILLSAEIYGSSQYGIIYRIITRKLGIAGKWNLRGVSKSMCVKRTLHAPWGPIYSLAEQPDHWKNRPQLLKFYGNIEKYRRIQKAKADIMAQNSHRSEFLILNDYAMTRDTETPFEIAKTMMFEESGSIDELLR